MDGNEAMKFLRFLKKPIKPEELQEFYEIHKKEVEREVSNRLEKLGYASTVPSCVQNGGLCNRIKNFYVYENEWKVWSDRDKLYWTFTIIILALIAVLCA